jgi:signal transduction histidine kinase
VALLDDMARPVALSHPDFRANWKRPFAATEIGEVLPHWEVGVYLLNPAKLTQSARTLKLTLGWLIGVLVLAIGLGSWLIVSDLNRQLTLARRKTDFVSNVSHELKTPLTSIRMFSELLADGRVLDSAKQRSYLCIITAEAARLTRLINNVLDFARLERGEKKYHFEKCDLVALVRNTAETYRPHLESEGFHFTCELPDASLCFHGDRDAVAQVVVNLLSNAEKYSRDRKEIQLRVQKAGEQFQYVEVRVLDRGLGVPAASVERIFEQFFRADDSLSSGIPGSGLGLTLARQIARAHTGDVIYEPREGGGSCFLLRLPLFAT